MSLVAALINTSPFILWFGRFCGLQLPDGFENIPAHLISLHEASKFYLTIWAQINKPGTLTSSFCEIFVTSNTSLNSLRPEDKTLIINELKSNPNIRLETSSPDLILINPNWLLDALMHHWLLNYEFSSSELESFFLAMGVCENGSMPADIFLDLLKIIIPDLEEVFSILIVFLYF